MTFIMSKFVHVPWTLGILAVTLVLHLLHVPASFVGATGGLLFCATREETQREYQIIETLSPPLRSGLHMLDAFKVWNWNRHSINESLVAIAAAYVAAGVVWLVVGV
jgi:hypothetical protein